MINAYRGHFTHYAKDICFSKIIVANWHYTEKKIAMVLIFMLSVVFGITVAVIVEFSKVMEFLKSMENSRWLPFYMAIYKFYNLLGYDDTDIAKAGFKLETRT